MSKMTRAISELTQAVIDLTNQQSRATVAMTDVAREQRITNLIVRSQIATEPAEKQRLMQEAVRRMEAPRRRTPHDRL